MGKKVTLAAGKHVLRLDVTKEYFDIDYINFVKGDVPVEEDPMFVQPSIQIDENGLQDYFVFDAHGVNLGVLSAYGFEGAAEILQNTGDIKASGIYYLRNRWTGKMQSVRISR